MKITRAAAVLAFGLFSACNASTPATNTIEQDPRPASPAPDPTPSTTATPSPTPSVAPSSTPSPTPLPAVSLENGVVTLRGSGFGSKTTAAPLRFDTFEGADGTRITDLGWWNTRTGDSSYSPLIKAGVSRVPGRNVADLSTTSTHTPVLFKNGVGFKATRKAYVNWWAYLDLTTFDGVPVQVKLLNLLRNVDPASTNNQYPDQATSLWNTMAGVTQGTLARYYYGAGSAPSLSYKDTTGNNSNIFQTAGWYNFTVQVDQGTIGQADGKTSLSLTGPGYNGYGLSGDSSYVMQLDAGDYLDSIKVWQYLQFRTEFTDANTFLTSYSAGYPAGSRVNYMGKGYRCILDTGPKGSFTGTPDTDTVHWTKLSDSPLVISDTVYIDSLYFDNSFARVELCDSATWSTRKHCEIQPATSWSDSTVAVTFNRGSFATGTATFFHIIDETAAPHLVSSTAFQIP